MKKASVSTYHAVTGDPDHMDDEGFCDCCQLWVMAAKLMCRKDECPHRSTTLFVGLNYLEHGNRIDGQSDQED